MKLSEITLPLKVEESMGTAGIWLLINRRNEEIGEFADKETAQTVKSAIETAIYTAAILNVFDLYQPKVGT